MRSLFNFKIFIVLSIAIAMGLRGYTIARVEHSIHRQSSELAQERLNACKFKLYDLAVGAEAYRAHLKRGPQHDLHQAAVLKGALRVVLSIPSAKACIPVITEALHKQHIELTPRIEHELVKLAQESEKSTIPLSFSVPPSETSHAPSHHRVVVPHSQRKEKSSSPTVTTPSNPAVTVSVPSFTSPPTETTPQKTPVVKVKVKAPNPPSPPSPTPPTPPKVEVPSLPTPELPEVKIETKPVETKVKEAVCHASLGVICPKP